MREQLDSYWERALEDEQRELIDQHLDQCASCRQELSELQELYAILEDPDLQAMLLHEPSPLPDNFTDQVMLRVMDERPTGVNLIWPWLRRRWSGRQYASVAYAMSATMVVVSAGNLLFVWNETTDRLGVWGAQAQAYWEALQAQVGGTGGYMLSSIWHWLSALIQKG